MSVFEEYGAFNVCYFNYNGFSSFITDQISWMKKTTTTILVYKLKIN